LSVNANNIIEYAFYEKSTTSNRCLQSDTALNQNCLIRSLANEVGRRLDSFSQTVRIEERIVALNIFSQKLINSGHSLKTIRGILVSGITGHVRKVARCKKLGTPLHRSANQSANSRRTKKLLARSQWFRSSKEGEEEEATTPPATSEERRVADRGAGGKQAGSNITNKPQERSAPVRTTTVLFVEFSKEGSLQKEMRGVLDRLKPMLGFGVRVTERGGTTLGSMLSNKNLWNGQPCGRPKCRPCAQEGEKKEACTSKNIVYESECRKCNPPGSRKEQDKKGLEEKRAVASLYVGETGEMERLARKRHTW
jgi:hypothetical protein